MNGLREGKVRLEECFYPQCEVFTAKRAFRVERVEVIGGVAVERGKKVPACDDHGSHYEDRAALLRSAAELRGLPDRLVSPHEVVGRALPLS